MSYNKANGIAEIERPCADERRKFAERVPGHDDRRRLEATALRQRRVCNGRVKEQCRLAMLRLGQLALRKLMELSKEPQERTQSTAGPECIMSVRRYPRAALAFSPNSRARGNVS